MKRIILGTLAFSLFFTSSAQDENSLSGKSLGKIIEELTYNWDDEAVKLNNYGGLNKFCASPEYRNEIISLLKDIHHYDSALYDRLVKASRFSKDKEIEKTMKEIEKFETEYDMKSFLHFLHEECVRVKDIEHNADISKNDIAENSYDGQVYLVETELNKYIKHITKRMDHIRKHIHHLHLD